MCTTSRSSRRPPIVFTGLLRGAGGRALGGQVQALAARVACQQADLDEALRLGEQAVQSERMRRDAAGLANALDARAAARLCGVSSPRPSRI